MKSLTYRAILLIFSGFFVGGCALWDSPPVKESMGPQYRIFEGSYDEVWRAVQKSLASYPIQINNIDQGIIETDNIKGDQIWRPPFQQDRKPINLRYVIRVNVVKGRPTKKGETVKVTILKSITLEKDFFSGESRQPSDGFEEKALLYRISREVQLERSLRRAFEKGKI